MYDCTMQIAVVWSLWRQACLCAEMNCYVVFLDMWWDDECEWDFCWVYSLGEGGRFWSPSQN